ncbi:acyl-CoA/acyl-ACP dehydrogenase, partial [bacterium]|nr:acyl-CoA/acyl-ACP dehydrogenase [bacterium]
MNLEMGPEDVQFQKEFALFSDQILEPIASQIDNSGVFQSRFFDIAKERKLLTPFLPIELGGQGKGLQTLTILLEELGRNSPVASLLVAQQVIFGIRTILSDSNLPEREELAKKAANFDLILTLAATEFEAGCDLSAITTVCRQKTESCFSISGKKAYVNWASRSGFLFTFTETESTDSASGTSLFAIPNPSKGLSVGTPYKTMGFSGLETSPVDFDDCRVEAFQVIGVHGFGDHIFEKITNELRIAMAAIATG